MSTPLDLDCVYAVDDDGKNVTPVGGKELLTRVSPIRRAVERRTDLKYGQQPGSWLMHDLGADIYRNLISLAPDLPEPDETPRTRRVTQRVLEWLQNEPEYAELVETINGRRSAAADATTAVWSKVTNDDVFAQFLEEQEELNEMIEQNAGGGDDAPSDDDIANKQAGLDNFMNTMQGIAQASMKNAVADVAKDAKDEAQAAEVAAAWGDDNEDVTGDEDLSRVTEALRQLSPAVQAIVRIAGRARNIAMKPGKVYDFSSGTPEVQRTRDLTKVFTSNRIRLSGQAPPAMRAMAVAQYAAGGLLGMSRTIDGREEGAFVTLIDMSGSMIHNVTLDGETFTRGQVAIGLALGLATVAKDSGRRYVLRAFGGSSVDTRTLTVRDDEDWAAHIRWAAQNTRGGTPLNEALGETLDLLEELVDDGELTDADILVLTDGESGVEQDTIDRFGAVSEELGTRLMEVTIGHHEALQTIRDARVIINQTADKGFEDISEHIGSWVQQR